MDEGRGEQQGAQRERYERGMRMRRKEVVLMEGGDARTRGESQSIPLSLHMCRDTEENWSSQFVQIPFLCFFLLSIVFSVCLSLFYVFTAPVFV